MRSAGEIAIPQTAAELTPEWFTSVIAPPARIIEVAVTPVGAGVGFMGELYRCGLSWEQSTSGQHPESVIVKLPSNNPDNRALGEALRSYEREIEIYRLLGQDLGVSMPRLYHAALDSDPAPWLDRPIVFLLERLSVAAVNRLLMAFVKLSGKSQRRYLLVIEDICDARPPTQLQGGSLDDASSALKVLARFHAANWMRQQAIQRLDWLWPLNRTPKAFQASYRRNRDAFVQQWGPSLGAPVIAWLDDIDDRLPEMSNSLVAAPWTLVHGDFRLDNLLFRPDGEIVVLDYQGVGYGRPGFDVAYFITTALDPQHKFAETDLLHAYHDELLAAGVTEYAWDELLIDCTLTKGLLAHRFVCGRDLLDTDIDGSEASLLDVMTTRAMGWFAPNSRSA